ncbi:MAG: archease [Deltaproteobacteria bacterium]
MGKFTFVPHTADVAVKIEGGSLKELFGAAAKAMFAVLVVKKANGPAGDLTELAIEKKEGSLEDLLKAWLDELLFEFQANGRILHRIKALSVGEDALSARVLSCALNRDLYDVKDEIKAVTYHELKVVKARRGWEAFVVFDV